LGEIRRQEAAFAAIVDREREVGGIEDRHALELELHRARRAEALLEVELDLGALDLPRAVPLRARREEERRQGQPALAAADEDVLAGAARRSGRNLEAGRAEEDALLAPIEHGVFPEDIRLRALVRDPP